jgi:formylmethanofuran dehydrogenase subunit B
MKNEAEAASTTRPDDEREPALDGAVCAGCGCLCDDIGLRFAAGKVASMERACELGQAWFRGLEPLAAEALVQGKAATLERAIAAAADLLRGARAPVIAGLCELTVEALREAVLLAESLPAVLAPHPALPGAARAGLDAPEVTATLGEVRGTADLVIFWRADPARTHPRHLERYSLEPPLVAGGKRAIAVVEVLGPEENATAGHAGSVLVFESAGHGLAADIEIVRTARMRLERGDDAPVPPDLRLAVEGLERLLDQARHAHVVLGGRASRASALANEFHLLAARLRPGRRLTVSALPPPGNARGAVEVLAWQTGRAGTTLFRERGAAVDLSGALDFPALLAREAADLVLAAGLDPTTLDGAARKAYARSARVVIGRELDPAAAVSIRIPGLDPRLSATVVRADGIHLTLNGRSAGPWPAADPACELLAALAARAPAPGPGESGRRPR